MLGIGTDILALERFRNVLETGGEAFVMLVYTEAEQKSAEGRDEAEVFLATRFAGKEAVFKCLNTTWDNGLTMRDIEILDAENGAPRVFLHGRAAEIAEQKGIRGVLISLSFEREYAIAMAAAVSGAGDGAAD